MSRDVANLRVFREADDVVVDVYQVTRGLPGGERFGLTSQIRRAAVSVPSNLVEGAARTTTRHFLQFVETALGSASETRYLLTLSVRLGLLESSAIEPVTLRYTIIIKSLQKLLDSLRTVDRRLKTEDHGR
jgi:four helix bundle protein